MENEEVKNSGEEKKEESLKPVVQGKVSVKKKSEGRKFMETFFQGDLDKVSTSIWSDVVVPMIRDMLWGALERAGRGIIYGDFESRSRRDNDNNSIRARQVDFTRYSKPRDRKYDYERSEDVYNYGELVIESRRDAEAILDRMNELLDSYRWVSVAQLYELANLSSKYTDRNYGWRDLRDAYITTTRGGYLIKLPRPRPFD